MSRFAACIAGWVLVQGAAAPSGLGRSSPGADGCSASRIVEGHKCVPCKRILSEDDRRGDRCKRCEEKTQTVEYCLKATPPFYQATCHPRKKGTKPVYC
jgi:hypothetical protein